MFVAALAVVILATRNWVTWIIMLHLYFSVTLHMGQEKSIHYKAMSLLRKQ